MFLFSDFIQTRVYLADLETDFICNAGGLIPK